MQRQFWWLVAAILLFGAGALIMALGDRAPRPAARAEVSFPRGPRGKEYLRMQERRTLPPVPIPGPERREPPPKRDPFLASLPRGPAKAMLVFEANALRWSRLGELFVECMVANGGHDLQDFERETGIDPLKDIDRVAVTDDGVVVSGFFDRAKWEHGSTPRRYGGAGVIYEGSTKSAQMLGVWRNQIAVMGSEERIKSSLDQLEGRAPAGELPFPEEMAYGEAYGVIQGSALTSALPGVQSALSERFERLDPRIEIHVDAMKDLAMVARVSGADGAGIDDLGKALGAALSLGRLEARASRDEELADLLEFAQVVPRDGKFTLELALPADRLEKWFANCGKKKEPGGP